VASAIGLRQAYQEARRALELGEVLAEDEVLHCYDDYVLQDLLDATPEQGRRLIAQTIAPLLGMENSGERLIETLRAYFRSGRSLKLTAADLGVHRNTLAYRLRQIRRLTGLDLERPEQQLLVESALQVLALQRKRNERPSH
jgi:purine catabolism regulator